MPAHSGKPERDLLAGLSEEGDPLVAKLQSGLDRSFALITPAWEDGKIPRMLAAIPMTHFSAFQRLMRLLTLGPEYSRWLRASSPKQQWMFACCGFGWQKGWVSEPTLVDGVMATANGRCFNRQISGLLLGEPWRIG